VALGRALSFAPGVLLLDEPLSALDEESRDQAYEVLSRVQRLTHVTVLHITHNAEECQRLAGQSLRMVDGRVTDITPPSGDRKTATHGESLKHAIKGN
jgi:ABC-type sulfate/molybdate transport systems ATPase subunit